MIRARGRNGWFEVDKSKLYIWIGTCSPGIPVNIHIYSKRLGDTAPIIFKGSIKEVEEFFAKIQEEIEKQKEAL